jgi:hypothetical protein
MKRCGFALTMRCRTRTFAGARAFRIGADADPCNLATDTSEHMAGTLPVELEHVAASGARQGAAIHVMIE